MNNAKQHTMQKEITIERVNKVILSVLQSPNKSAQRAALWMRLHTIKSKLNNKA